MHRRGVDDPVSRSDAARVAAAGTSLALVVTAALAAGGLLRGPSILGTRGAGAESAVVAILVGLCGWWFAVRPRGPAPNRAEH